MTADGKTLLSRRNMFGNFLICFSVLPQLDQLLGWHVPPTNEAIIMVNYAGKTANLLETGYQLKGSEYVISKFLSNTWLCDRVHVSGGTYGGFCDFDSHSVGLDDFKEFADVIESVEDKGVVDAVVSPDDIDAATKRIPTSLK